MSEMDRRLHERLTATRSSPEKFAEYFFVDILNPETGEWGHRLPFRTLGDAVGYVAWRIEPTDVQWRVGTNITPLDPEEPGVVRSFNSTDLALLGYTIDAAKTTVSELEAKGGPLRLVPVAADEITGCNTFVLMTQAGWDAIEAKRANGIAPV